MIWKSVAAACAAGAVAAAALTGPALAAAPPTLAGPADRTGFGLVTLTGTAAPGAAVVLYESAMKFDDLAPADDWQHGGGPVTATANAAGRYEIARYLDTGFYFQVESGGVRSPKITVRMRVLPTLQLTSAGGEVTARVTASPAQPFLPVELQRAGSGGTWSTVAAGPTDDGGGYTATVSGAGTYRAHIGADAENGILANYSASQAITGGGAPVPVPDPAPAPSPAPSPAPAPAPAPAAGSVQFTRIQYNAPGADTGSNTSLNGEWARLTNKTGSTVDLKGWTVRDAAAHVYTFPSTLRLGAGKSVVVRTGKGTSTTTTRYWGRSGHVWNNGGDTATLRTGAGKTVDTCRWGAGGSATNC